MSDRQNGVVKAIETYWPTAESRFCARHIYANFRLNHPGQKLKRLFWKASRSCTVYEFRDALAEIGKVDADAKIWLEKLNPSHWSRHGFDVSVKCDHVTNNMTESFNSMLGEHGSKTYLGLLEYIRRMVMLKFQQRKEEAARWSTELPPTVHSKIFKASKQSRMLTILSAGNGEYELLAEKRAYVAKLNQMSCECGLWQLSGVPCNHALAGIGHYCLSNQLGEQIVDFVHPWLTKTAFLKTYATMIHPIPDEIAWPDIQTAEIIPPTIRTQPGRPKVSRTREAGEQPKQPRRGTKKCSKCGILGHNKSSCKDGATSSNPRKRNKKHKTVAAASTSQEQSLPQSQLSQQ